ncbi:Uncharacterized protein TCM_042855 [Theobroma cacao]|uniref:F-box family protein n=1 Tax=Theobroma cacao TaxID=3641 RepID=A0A061FLU5_THECC|nr:Uncharacterized protein TCM_042855 [Theobroma cacao]
MHDGSLEDAAITVLNFLNDFAELHRPRNKWSFQFDFGQGKSLLAAIASNNTLHLDFSAFKQENPRPFNWLLKLNHPLSEQWLFPYNSNELLEPNGPLPKPHHRLSSYIFKQKICISSYGLQSLDMEDATGWFNLDDTMLDFRQGPGFKHDIDNDSFISSKSIQFIELLTLCRWVFKRLKELWWIDYSTERHNVNSLLCFLKLCPRLRRLYVIIDAKCYNMTSTKRIPGVEMIIELEKLELLKLEGFANENEEINFIKQLTPLFKARPVIITKSNGTCSRCQVELPELEKEGNYAYKFEQVKNLHEKWPHHVHMKL